MKLVEGENAKWCGKCLNLKSFDEFVKNKNGSCGLDFSCIECNKVYRRSKIEYKTRKNIRVFRDKLLQHKHCARCRKHKPWNEFNKENKGVYGKKSYCRICETQYYKEYAKNNVEKLNKKKRKWVKENPDKRKKASLKWFRNNKDQIKEHYEENKEEILKRQKKYYIINREKINKRNSEYQKANREEVNAYIKNKYHTDVNYKIRRLISGRILDVLNGRTKTDTTKNILGCSIKKFKQHIEDQFTDGMTWDNWTHDGWHLDHIIPCANFDLECGYQQAVCFHWSNYQPLWGSENMSKNANIPDLGIKIDKEWINQRHELLTY